MDMLVIMYGIYIKHYEEWGEQVLPYWLKVFEYKLKDCDLKTHTHHGSILNLVFTALFLSLFGCKLLRTPY